MHLHNGMRALAAALVATGGRVQEVDDQAVLDDWRQRRRTHYGFLSSGPLAASKFLVASVLLILPEAGASQVDVKRAIRRTARPDTEDGWSLPDGMTVSEFFDLMVRRGVLQEAADAFDQYACPIPSYRQFLIEAGASPRSEPESC